MLNPPIRNNGLSGMRKWAANVRKWPEQFEGMKLSTGLFNLFVYIEIAGTGGICFGPMYAQFLDEASVILSKPDLKEVADMFRESGKIWRDIAVAAMLDSWGTLRRIRELSLEKNRVFEEQGPDAYKRMREISAEVDDFLIRKRAAEEFKESDQEKMAPLLADLRQKILEMYKIEKDAFVGLREIIR